ncbi:MAG TPA: DUF1257 domain-containing protein [Candidatus Ozemobacteraceae bacterium]|nr:DUF1257 domain-containing protein [Candidatus Ozemobacteraceae bacterium]
MSAVVLMVPAMASGPVFAAAVAVAGAAIGLKTVAALMDRTGNAVTTQNAAGVDVQVPNAHALAASVDEGDILPLEGNGFRVTFSKDGRGNCSMRVEGQGKTDAELEALGRELINRAAQQYAYQKLSAELKKKGYNLVQEKVEEDKTIRLTVRRWK